ncbi:E3 ubiquitin-protein ligase TTC3 isoform X2 [Narcine bancroftii]|uniref:E3 ubiquitin-protein ligase TTC3 isoform X2 n=1 Tax=Narcine bancroftii TaxID=1343680 RepID=UPI0038315618
MHSVTFLTCLLDSLDKVDKMNCDLDDAIAIVKNTEELNTLQEEVKFGTKRSRMAAIAIGCFQYAYFIKPFLCTDTIPLLVQNRNEKTFQECEDYRERGNNEFVKKNFKAAVNYYSRAIELCPDSKILYGNRALCFYRVENFRKAMSDAKRAIILNPDWAKGHYRFCDSLFSMGEQKRAIEANTRAQELCKNDPNGVQDLIHQKAKFLKRLHDGNAEKPKTDPLKKELNIKKEQPPLATQPVSECPKNESKRSQERNGLKNRLSLGPKISMPLNSSETKMDKLKSLINVGHLALMDQRARNAERAFLEVLKLMDPENLEEVSLSTIDYVIIIYGHACALLGIGLPEELAKAEYQFNKILEQFPEHRLDCLAFFGLGKVYCQQNRFIDALDPFTKSLKMVNHKIVPGILTWPTTTIVIEETQNEKLKALLEEYIGKCKFPPQSDAVCCYQHCQGHSKTQIYFSDPDFKGFIRMMCILQCHLEYHINCWKKLKAALFQDKNDKDFLKDPCFTPDCGGQISKIVIYDSKGLVKCEFEAKIKKNKKSPKRVVKQKCSSALKLKIKEHRKQARKLRKEASRSNAEKQLKKSVEINNKTEETNSKTGNSWNSFGDRMLQLIIKNKEKLKAGGWNITNLLQELQSFRVLSKEDCDKLSASVSKPCQVMDQLLDLIVQENNRVKTRTFVYILTKCQKNGEKLLEDWISWLNDAGCEAAKLFLLRYSKFIEQLDLDSLLNLLKESEIDLPLYDNTKQLVKQLMQESPTKTRSFIWMLEEKRDQFPSLHNPLDEYFNTMDIPCTVLKKQENEELSNANLKSKIRNRKKKSKDSKSMILLSGMFGDGTREEEDDEIYSDDGYLVHLNSADIFTIPDHLCLQPECEDVFEDTSADGHYHQLVGSNPDLTRESLYEYFAQILNVHGPLEVDDPLLIREFEDFPQEARELVQRAGGLESFLMDSFWFVKIGPANHAIQSKSSTANDKASTRSTETSKTNLDEIEPVVHLNPAAKEFKPVSYHSSIFMSDTSSLSELQNNQYLYYNTELGGNIDGNMYFNYYPDAKTPKSAIISDHNLKTSDPMTGYYLHASECSSVFDSTSCGDPPSSATHPVFSGHQSNPSIINYNDPFHSLNSSGGSDPAINEMENMKLRFGSSNANTVSTLEERSGNLKTESSNGASNKTSRMEYNYNNKRENKQGPLLRTIAVQVHREPLCNTEINTDPFQPFENQQGDILRIDKEYNVLQHQLQEAEEKYDQLANHSKVEIIALEEKMSEAVHKNEQLKAELDSVRQVLESEVKKSQHEKRENNETLKKLKSKVKSLAEMNQVYTQNIEEKAQLYKKCFKDFEEVSDQSSKEKKKLEEAIQKSVAVFHETSKRATEAEVAVLEEQQKAQLYFHYQAAEDAKRNLEKLKTLNASAIAEAIPELQMPLDAWKHFLFEIEWQIRQTEMCFKDQITQVRAGTQLSSLAAVAILNLPTPPSSSVMLERSSIDDPAIIASVPPGALLLWGIQNHHKSILQASSVPREKPLSSITRATKEKAQSSSSFQNQYSSNHSSPLAQPQSVWSSASNHLKSPAAPKPPQSTDAQPSTRQPTHAKSPQPKNNFDKIILCLSTMFPDYTHASLTNFIKQICSSNRSSLVGLADEEIINQVAGCILDHQDKNRIQFPSANWQQATMQRASSATNQVPTPKSTTRNIGAAASLSHPWQPINPLPASQWQSSDATTLDEPCIICHDDLTPDSTWMLQCKHHFHQVCIKKWLKTNRSCPTCRVHALLPEDFPLLPGKLTAQKVPFP